MKKWFIRILLVVIAGCIICIYLFIPSGFVISRSSQNKVVLNGAFRVLANNAKWKKWWRNEAGQSPSNTDSLQYNGFTFRVISHELNVVGVEITRGNLKLNSIIYLITVGSDSTLIYWKTDSIPAGFDPVSRLMTLKKASLISESLKSILQNLKPYLSNTQNVYDLNIFWTSARDSTMLSSRFTSVAYPTTQELYGYFDAVKKSVEKQKGNPVSYPMMNIRKLEDSLYETQVGIPTDRMLRNDGKIVSMRMVPSDFIGATVNGGIYTTTEAMKQLEFFVADYNKWKIANPFQMLITDRSKEPDTLKWITRLYIPIVPDLHKTH